MTDETAAQERIFTALCAHPGVIRIDTHAASVFLDGGRALKIKRAVRFPFLDYSTLEKRKAACEEEIRINRPLAPQIYHRVVAITEEPDGSLQVDGRGRPVEYAVDMSRFDETRTLDHLAKAGPLDANLASAAADAIVASHAMAPRADGTAWVASIPGLVDGNGDGLRKGNHLEAEEIEQLGEASYTILQRLRPLLEERGRQGYVRRCHGDLHLANIVAIDDQPVLFDAIEFDARIATVDVLYDLAFTLMDLLHHGQPLAANIVLNRYLAATPPENLDALSVLPLFMSIRAAIRAQVALARLTRPDADRTGILHEAHRYFDLARALIHPPTPRLIAVGGLSGTGKSALARALAPNVAPQTGSRRAAQRHHSQAAVSGGTHPPAAAVHVPARGHGTRLRGPGAERPTGAGARPFRNRRCRLCKRIRTGATGRHGPPMQRAAERTIPRRRPRDPSGAHRRPPRGCLRRHARGCCAARAL